MTARPSPFRARRVLAEQPAPVAGASDYADAFEIRSPAIASTTAQQLAAHAARVPSPRVAAAIKAAFRYAVGSPNPAAPGTDILGWPVVHSDARVVRLEGRSRLLHGVVVFSKPEPDVARISTFVGYQHPFTRVIWAALSPAHRRVAPRLLKRCVTSSLASAHEARRTAV